MPSIIARSIGRLFDAPVAARLRDVVAHRIEPSDGPRNGFASQRRAEALVAPLMGGEQFVDLRIACKARLPHDAAIDIQCEEHGRIRRSHAAQQAVEP